MTKRLMIGGSCVLLLLTAACQKWKDEKGATDPRLDQRVYCNDPEAVNYNWDFPGKPDNTVCFYPADVFEGRYQLTDSLYNSDNTRDTSYHVQLSFTIYRLSKRQLALVGFCGNTADTLKLTADRYYRATVDTTITNGQPFCSPADTLSGYIQRTRTDSSGSLQVNFMVTGDTNSGIHYHRGTAIKL